MEKEAVNTAIITTTTTTAITSNDKNNNNIDNKNSKNGKQKKRSRFQMLKVALFMIRGQSNKKSKPVHVDVASKGLWKKLVGAMRPLHHQGLSNQNSPPPMITGSHDDATILPNLAIDNSPLHDGVFSPPMSSPQVYHPDTPSSSSSVADSMSRYASAQDLQELDKNGESNNGDDEYFFGGDEYIDAKAEEFIAQFYEQMRLQQIDDESS